MRIPDRELHFSATRASGPGGQGVNTTDSAVQLRWNVYASQALTYEQRGRVLEKLSNQLTKDGDLVIKIQTTRSQKANKERAVEVLHDKIVRALYVKPSRIATKPTRSSKERRLTTKKQTAYKKSLRRSVFED